MFVFRHTSTLTLMCASVLMPAVCLLIAAAIVVVVQVAVPDLNLGLGRWRTLTTTHRGSRHPS
mgnify:CR=1 FL=1